MADEPPEDNDKEQKVPIDKIGTAPLRQIPDEPVPKGQNPLTGRNEFKDELGWVGKFIGGRTEKAGNIAFLVVAVTSLLLIILTVAWIAHDPAKGEFKAGSMFTPLVGLLGTAAGFMFGKGSNGKED